MANGRRVRARTSTASRSGWGRQHAVPRYPRCRGTADCRGRALTEHRAYRHVKYAAGCAVALIALPCRVVPVAPSLPLFTPQELEKTPLADVPAEPSELLDRTRYQKASRVLSDEREEIYAQLIAAMQEKVEKRGVSVKPFFDDAANNPNSMKLYGHVTTFQFKQVLNTSLHWSVSDEEADILVEKFRHEDKLEFVNYVAFSNTVDSPDNEW